MKDFIIFIGLFISLATFVILVYIAFDGIIMQERSLINRFLKKK